MRYFTTTNYIPIDNGDEIKIRHLHMVHNQSVELFIKRALNVDESSNVDDYLTSPNCWVSDNSNWIVREVSEAEFNLMRDEE